MNILFSETKLTTKLIFGSLIKHEVILDFFCYKIVVVENSYLIKQTNNQVHFVYTIEKI